MNILFLCTANLNRSKTFEHYFAVTYPEHQYKSAGLSYRLCKEYRTNICTIEQLEWADRIFVMEQMHYRRIEEHAGQKYLSKIVVLDIPDRFKYGCEELINQVEKLKLCFNR